MARMTNPLTSIYKIEAILISLNNDNYKSILENLISGLREYDFDLVKKLEKYTYIADQQLNHRALNIDLLKKEFPSFNFVDVKPLTNNELLDYVTIFINQKQQRVIASNIGELSDKVRETGITPEIVEQFYKFASMAEMASDYVPITSNYKELYQAQVKMQGLSFLCPEIDKLTGGLSPGQLCTVLGAPGSMKTTYTSNVAFNAIKEGKNVLYLSLEEPPMQLYGKWLSRASIDCGKPLPAKDITQKKLDEGDQKIFMNDVIPYFEKLPGKLYIVGEQDIPNYMLTTLESKFKEIDNLAQKETGHGIDLLVVDHIQLIKFADAAKNEFSVINMYVSFFRQQALSWLHEKREIIVILLSQANREGYYYAQKHNGMYRIQHVAEASEIERASAYIISVYTDAMVQVSKLLKLGAIKLRGAQLPLDTINVFADGEFYQVGDAAIPEQENYSAGDLFVNQEQSMDIPGINTSESANTLNDMIDALF